MNTCSAIPLAAEQSGVILDYKKIKERKVFFL